MLGLLKAIELIKQFYTAEVQAYLDDTAAPSSEELYMQIQDKE